MQSLFMVTEIAQEKYNEKHHSKDRLNFHLVFKKQDYKMSISFQNNDIAVYMHKM